MSEKKYKPKELLPIEEVGDVIEIGKQKYRYFGGISGENLKKYLQPSDLEVFKDCEMELNEPGEESYDVWYGSKEGIFVRTSQLGSVEISFGGKFLRESGVIDSCERCRDKAYVDCYDGGYLGEEGEVYKVPNERTQEEIGYFNSLPDELIIYSFNVGTGNCEIGKSLEDE